MHLRPGLSCLLYDLMISAICWFELSYAQSLDLAALHKTFFQSLNSIFTQVDYVSSQRQSQEVHILNIVYFTCILMLLHHLSVVNVLVFILWT